MNDAQEEEGTEQLSRIEEKVQARSCRDLRGAAV
jgi:hypothetical protein